MNEPTPPVTAPVHPGGEREIRRDGKVLRWCATHDEPTWVYSDGSVTCPYDLIVESNNEHEITEGPWVAGSPPQAPTVDSVPERLRAALEAVAEARPGWELTYPSTVSMMTLVDAVLAAAGVSSDR